MASNIACLSMKYFAERRWPECELVGTKDVELKVTFYFGKRSREDIVYLTGSEASSNESQDDKHTELEYR